MKQTILYFQSTDKVSALQKLEGAYGHARAHGWDLQVIEPTVDERKAHELRRFWEPTGVIVECGTERNHLDPAIFGGIPIVFLDRNPRTLRGRQFCVMHDSAATARLAAKELLSLKLRSFAFVPWPEPRFWSHERENGFAEALRLNGHDYARFDVQGDGTDVLALQTQLERWLAGLPKPVGVFAANDRMAARVLSAAGHIGIAVPNDLAVIGVDNDELLCENTTPTLSSVMADFTAAGRLAAEMLAGCIAGRHAKPRTATFGPLRIVRRASTSRSARNDPDVLAACDIIRRRACDGLRARDVIALFSCSRRMAEIRFRKATGHSILDEIQAHRLAKAETMLRNATLDRNAIANFCGYASGNALMNFLRTARTRH